MTDKSKALVFRLNDHGQGPEIIRQMFLERGWIEFDEVQQEDEDWNIWWRTSRFRNCDYDFLQSWQRLNHYPKSVGITKKDCLARNLKRMKGVHGTGVYNFSPIAFNLPNDYTRYVAEYGRLKQQQNDGKSLLWICKPADMSRGRGIFLFRDISELQYDCNAVVQRYIAKPMLIGGYKFDLRIYVAVPSFHPLSVYIYEEGIVRFSTEKYDLNTLTNVFAHLTNTSINKHSPSYTTDKEYIGPGCKWTLTQLRHYFHQNNINDNILWIRILNIIILTILIQAPQVPKCTNCFELYGFDVLIDENLKPWLLEVNFSPSLSADCQVDMVVKKPLLHDIIQLMNFKESDVLRGGEKLKRQSTRIKGNETIDRYASSSRLSHHSSIQRGSSFHKNISSLSKQSTVERELASYIEQDSDEIKIKVKGDECLGLPLVNTKEDSRPNSGSSGISSSHSDLRQVHEEVHKPIKNSIKRSKSADTRISYDETVGSREKVKFYIGQKRIDDNNNVSKSTSVNNIRVPRSAVTRESSSRYPRIDRQTTSSSFAKSEISHRHEKGSIKSSATSDSAISSFSGSSENSDLISLPVESMKATPRLLSQRQNVVPAVEVSASNSSSSVTESSQTMKIKSLRPNGNSSTFRKISALGVSNAPSQLNSNRSRSRMQTNISNSSVSNYLPNVGYKKLQTTTPVPKVTITPRHGSIPRNIPRNPVAKYYGNNNGRNSSQANINLTRSQLFVSNSPTQSQTIRSSLQSNSRDLGQRNTNNSRLSIRRDSLHSKHPVRPRMKGPAPIVGDFFLGFPFSEISLKAANTTLDAHVVVKETQRLLKEALVKVDKISGDIKVGGHLPYGASEWERRLWGPVKPQEENS
ncbi:tubulin polyglutamylase TTLL7-like [Mytilus trossulus]|uniref:tubulin polyglutamylase TTLL7-like n=1 Tax=Mytilus trossulus TaxID=6551 RepID=UPI003006AFBA